MQRIPSTMTARQLQAWRERYALTLAQGAERLGVSVRLFQDYLAGRVAIPRTIALLCATYNKLWQNEKGQT